MNRTQKKRLFQGLLAMGIVLLVLSLLLDGRVPDSLGGMLCGIGSGLLAMAGSTLLNLRHEAKHPEMARQHDIEQKDERNTAIQNKARAISGDITMLAVLLAAMFFQAFEGPEIPGWISWLLLGIVIGNLFLSLAMHCWLQRKM